MSFSVITEKFLTYAQLSTVFTELNNFDPLLFIFDDRTDCPIRGDVALITKAVEFKTGDFDGLLNGHCLSIQQNAI